jgi:hypothetical protein
MLHFTHNRGLQGKFSRFLLPGTLLAALSCSDAPTSPEPSEGAVRSAEIATGETSPIDGGSASAFMSSPKDIPSITPPLTHERSESVD